MDDERDAFHATLAFLDEYDAGADFGVDRDEARGVNANVVVTPTALVKPGKRSAPALSVPSKRKASSVSAKAASPSPTLPVSVAASDAAKPPMPKSRKEELEFLREQVAEFEEKLRLLKKTSQRPISDGSSSESAMVVAGSPQTAPIASMWEELAMRQYQQRQRAEVENLKLKSMLEDQLKVAKSLERMLKRSKCDLLTPKNRLKRVRGFISPTPAEDDAVFEELSTTVVQMYTHVGEAFSDERFQRADTPFRDLSVQQHEDTGTCIELLNSRMIPFDMHATANAIWEYFVTESMEAQGFFSERDIEITDTSIKKSVRVELQVKRYFGRFRGKVVGRRYIEPDRVVIVWAVLVEPVEVSDASMDGIIMTQKGWTIVKRPDNVADVDTPEGASVSVIQTKHTAIPTVYDDVPDHKRKIELLTNYVIYMLHGHIESSQQMIENLLIRGMRCVAKPGNAA